MKTRPNREKAEMPIPREAVKRPVENRGTWAS